VQIAQNEPPAPPPASQVVETPAPPASSTDFAASNSTTTLPKTASPYPLFGLTGLLALALFGLVRMARTLPVRER